MKKLLLFAALMLVAPVFVACEEDETPKQEQIGGGSGGSNNGYEYVDLGLSVKWATCNIGASSPEEYGDYFAWGETSPKSNYTWDTYQHRTDYDGDGIDEHTPLGDISGTQYDAARANWGGSWRMPTKREMEELVNLCTWEWTTQGRHAGYEITGPNGNSIFLPAAGYCYGTSANGVGSYGYYWSSTPNGSIYSHNLYFDSGDWYYWGYWYYRDYGLSVRPVLGSPDDIRDYPEEDDPKDDPEENDPNNDPTTGSHNGYEYVDLGLSVKWATCNIGASSPEEYGDYFAWGETGPKSSYTWENYQHWTDYDGDGYDDYDEYTRLGDISGTQYDAARANWGGSWRMPTLDNIRELCENCIWEWTAREGVSGMCVTGPNGNSIFLPAAGYCFGTSASGVGSDGYYWSSTPDEGRDYGAYYLDFNSGGWSYWYDWNFRYSGRSVRPVLD